MPADLVSSRMDNAEAMWLWEEYDLIKRSKGDELGGVLRREKEERRELKMERGEEREMRWEERRRAEG